MDIETQENERKGFLTRKRKGEKREGRNERKGKGRKDITGYWERKGGEIKRKETKANKPMGNKKRDEIK